MRFGRFVMCGALELGTLGASNANASVTYSFEGGIAGSFVYTASNFITADTSIPATDLASCSVFDPPCEGVEFIPDASSYGAVGHTAIVLTGSYEQDYIYFAGGAFSTDGVYMDDLFDYGDTLTVCGAPTGGVPEPATWAMMLLGLGGLGAALRMRRGIAAASA